ncbi:hypothetical protein N0B44_08675 [Roseibacterium beibuensis]|uniref:hypothetical protein n=1 Tax=[Roseibacterium] beibuensis TaxID=1193142 RepID=UPI00217D87BC|nr:hypothetical protein [Roseibacterium beibuensis]MCS6622981.1 hypothetical protein [Roseibacterium beibuensis]
MTAERFLALVAAYGADRRRWPDGERAAAEAFAAAHADIAGPALGEADAVDALLWRSPTPQVPMALRDRVLAAAASAGDRAGRAGRVWIDRLSLVFGAGWAVATCAGVIAGVMLTSHLTADAQADAVLYQSSLLGVDDTEVLG